MPTNQQIIADFKAEGLDSLVTRLSKAADAGIDLNTVFDKLYGNQSKLLQSLQKVNTNLGSLIGIADDLTDKFKDLSSVITGGLAFRTFGKAVMDYNKNLYDLSRTAKITGQSFLEAQKGITRLTNETHLGIADAQELFKQFNAGTRGMKMSGAAFADISKTLTQEFGPSLEETSKALGDLMELQQKEVNVLKRVHEGFKPGELVGYVAMLRTVYGATEQQIETLMRAANQQRIADRGLSKSADENLKLAKTIQDLKKAGQKFLIDVGKPVIDILNQWTPIISNVITKVADFVSKHPDLVKMAAGAVGIGFALKTIIGPIVSVIGKFKELKREAALKEEFEQTFKALKEHAAAGGHFPASVTPSGKRAQARAGAKTQTGTKSLAQRSAARQARQGKGGAGAVSALIPSGDGVAKVWVENWPPSMVMGGGGGPLGGTGKAAKGGGLLSQAGGVLKGAGLFAAGGLAAYGSQAAGGALKESGHEKAGGALSAAGSVGGAALMGAQIGSIFPGLGTAIGGLAGAAVGVAMSWDDITDAFGFGEKTVDKLAEASKKAADELGETGKESEKAAKKLAELGGFQIGDTDAYGRAVAAVVAKELGKQKAAQEGKAGNVEYEEKQARDIMQGGAGGDWHRKYQAGLRGGELRAVGEKEARATLGEVPENQVKGLGADIEQISSEADIRRTQELNNQYEAVASLSEKIRSSNDKIAQVQAMITGEVRSAIGLHQENISNIHLQKKALESVEQALKESSQSGKTSAEAQETISKLMSGQGYTADQITRALQTTHGMQSAIKDIQAKKAELTSQEYEQQKKIADILQIQSTLAAQETSKLESQIALAKAQYLGAAPALDLQLQVLDAIDKERIENEKQMQFQKNILRGDKDNVDAKMRLNDLDIKNNNLLTKKYEITKNLREGYLDAMAAFTNVEGAFSKLILSQDVGLEELQKNLKASASITKGAIGAGGDKPMVEFKPGGGLNVASTEEWKKTALRYDPHALDAKRAMGNVAGVVGETAGGHEYQAAAETQRITGGGMQTAIGADTMKMAADAIKQAGSGRDDQLKAGIEALTTRGVSEETAKSQVEAMISPAGPAGPVTGGGGEGVSKEVVENLKMLNENMIGYVAEGSLRARLAGDAVGMKGGAEIADGIMKAGAMGKGKDTGPATHSDASKLGKANEKAATEAKASSKKSDDVAKDGLNKQIESDKKKADEQKRALDQTAKEGKQKVGDKSGGKVADDIQKQKEEYIGKIRATERAWLAEQKKNPTSKLMKEMAAPTEVGLGKRGKGAAFAKPGAAGAGPAAAGRSENIFDVMARAGTPAARKKMEEASAADAKHQASLREAYLNKKKGAKPSAPGMAGKGEGLSPAAQAEYKELQAKAAAEKEAKKAITPIVQGQGAKPKPTQVMDDEPVWGKASGGRIPGYGGGDSVPSLLEPGEFVINKKSAAAYKGLLHSINSNRFAAGGGVPDGLFSTPGPLRTEKEKAGTEKKPVSVKVESMSEKAKREAEESHKEAIKGAAAAPAAGLQERAVVSEVQNQVAGAGPGLDGGTLRAGIGGQDIAQGKWVMPKEYASGGKIPGYGGGDSVPSMLEPGEFVINKKAATAHRELLRSINSNRFAAGGVVPSPELARAGGGGFAPKFAINVRGDSVNKIMASVVHQMSGTLNSMMSPTGTTGRFFDLPRSG